MKHIDRSLNKELTILEIAFWLSQPEIQEEKSWSAFALQFFKRYRPDLEPWYGKSGMLEKQLKEADVYIFNVFLEIYNSIYLDENPEK